MDIKEISLRLLNSSDLSFLLEVRNSCKDALHDNREFTLKDCINWFTKTKPEFYVIEHNKQNIGYVRTSNLSKENRSITIGADIHPKYRRMGYASAAYMIIINYLFYKMLFNRIDLEVLSNNTPAILLYEKLGFRYEGLKREAIFRNGKYIDSILMSILKKEWPSTNYLDINLI